MKTIISNEAIEAADALVRAMKHELARYIDVMLDEQRSIERGLRADLKGSMAEIERLKSGKAEVTLEMVSDLQRRTLDELHAIRSTLGEQQ